MSEPKTSHKLIEYINKYAIGDICDLEELVNGLEVQIELKEPFFDSEIGKTYTIDGIDLNLKKYNLFKIKKEDLTSGCYDDFFVRFNNDFKKTTIQKLNYNDFLHLNHDFYEVVNDELLKVEKFIFEHVEHFIEQNLNNPEYSRHLINKIVLRKILYAHQWLRTNYINNKRDVVFPFLTKFAPYPQLLPIMQLVIRRQKRFIYRLKNDFKYYYDKDDFEFCIDTLENTHTNKSITIKKPKLTNWQKVAKFLAAAEFAYVKRSNDFQKHFYYEDKKYFSATELSLKLSEEIALKPDVIRNIISETFSNGKEKPNNIFYKSHLNSLLDIKIEIEKEGGQLNTIFSEEIERLERNM